MLPGGEVSKNYDMHTCIEGVVSPHLLDTSFGTSTSWALRVQNLKPDVGMLSGQDCLSVWESDATLLLNACIQV